MNTCSIIIPAYGRPDTLKLALDAITSQSIPPPWKADVIIVDDGSEPPIKLPIIRQNGGPAASWRANYQLPITVFRQPRAGSAKARNTGVKNSQAGILLFLGADIILRPGALARHLDFHARRPDTFSAALGMVKWDPRIRPTPLMEWMVHAGPQNDFDSLLGKYQADPAHYFYGSHISLKQAAMRPRQFPLVYGQYGWEDLDLGCQLKEAGLTLTVLHEAVGLHRHYYTAADILRRQRAAGRGVPLFISRHPRHAIRPRLSLSGRLKLLLYRLPGIRRLARLILSTVGKTISAPKLFQAITAAEFLADSGKMYYK